MIIQRQKYYYVSSNPDLENQIITPDIPNNFLSKGDFWNNKLPRIRLYKTVSDAISGIFLGQKLKKGMTLYVYQATNINPESLLGPMSLDNIPYFGLIKEWWYLKNCRFKLLGLIEVGDKLREEIYHYGPRQTKGIMYFWDWSEILKPWEKPKLKSFSQQQPSLNDLSEKQLEQFADHMSNYRIRKAKKNMFKNAAVNNTIAAQPINMRVRNDHELATDKAAALLRSTKARKNYQNTYKNTLINIINNDYNN